MLSNAAVCVSLVSPFLGHGYMAVLKQVFQPPFPKYQLIWMKIGRSVVVQNTLLASI